MREITNMTLKQDIIDMGCAALVLDIVEAPEWAAILREIATAADVTGNGDSPMMERMRWTPVVVHAGELSRKIMAASMDSAKVTGDVRVAPVTPIDFYSHR